jgi:hypothetical protein
VNKTYWILATVCLAAFSLPARASHELKKNMPVLPAIHTQAITPAKGSPDRQGILDALRGVVKNMSGLEVVFVVRHLKVKNNWAWVETDPQSKDGSQHYESIIGLLQKKNGRWLYVEGPPEANECDEDPECSDSARYFKKLHTKYPSTSMDIFPK